MNNEGHQDSALYNLKKSSYNMNNINARKMGKFIKNKIKVIVATMVKDEDDIVADWIVHHGEIFGYQNLHIIENYSSDNTYKICSYFLGKGVNLYRKDDYRKKGDYMTEIMRKYRCDFFIPLDIDEFIVLYDFENKQFLLDNIFIYLYYLRKTEKTFFKMNYFTPIKTNDNNDITKFSHVDIQNYNELAKTFINKRTVDNNFKFDHGNHVSDKEYHKSNLYLIHFHERSHNQVLKKISANVSGLGYDHTDVDKLESLGSVDGYHRIKQQIDYLKDKNICFSPPISLNVEGKIKIKELTEDLNKKTKHIYDIFLK